MNFVILGIIVTVIFISINKYVTSEGNHQELIIEELNWIVSISELIECKIIHDEKKDRDLKITTPLDSHGCIISVDLYTLNNRFHESISLVSEFDSKRFTKVT
ncbi:MAG: hypothetical protein RR945_00400 [Erysipelotrichaceae bacterium]